MPELVQKLKYESSCAGAPAEVGLPKISRADQAGQITLCYKNILQAHADRTPSKLKRARNNVRALDKSG